MRISWRVRHWKLVTKMLCSPPLVRLVLGLPMPQRKQLLVKRSGDQLTRMRAKRPRLMLDPEAYGQLCRKVLERDGWRCQICGRTESLQVHHIQRRSLLGDDAAENLITLCARCHQEAHRQGYTPSRANF
ncbi:MAG: hypothetical protein DMG32_26490 [Acidobacteria bacterium]|nr:MAG: hypothetical protein DMG32_26490 [Acidobacteriota bacterium]